MRVFEVCLNPKKRDDLFSTSFIYTPTNIYEKRLGNLYMVGELRQAMPQNSHFLTNLCSVIKKEYYSAGLKKNCEASLQEALKKGNEFLEQESKRGNIAWLGNLNFGILCFKEPVLNFAKAGDAKIFLARAGEIADIGRNLEAELSRSDPLKVFGSMAEGKLSADDRLIVIGKRILSAFGKKQNFLADIAGASDEKGLRQVLKKHQDVLANVSGNCLILASNNEGEVKQTVVLQRTLPDFSFSRNLIKPVVGSFAKIKPPRLKTPKISVPRLPALAWPGFPGIRLAVNRKKIILVASLVLILFAFYHIFQGERKRELQEVQLQMAEARSKAMLAESLLILKKDEQARTLFEEALDILSPLTKRGSPLRDDALFLQNSVKQRLK